MDLGHIVGHLIWSALFIAPSDQRLDDTQSQPIVQNEPMALNLPPRLLSACRRTPERSVWLDQLPEVVRIVEHRWSLTAGAPVPLNGDASCAWVAPVTLSDGTAAVLKLGMPHMEGEHELQGLRFWNGDPTVRLLDCDEELGAMLLERCEPGTPLRTLPDSEQDVVIAGLLHRLWRTPATPHPFRALSVMTEYWSRETLADIERWPDTGLVQEGLRLFQDLPSSATVQDVLLATDLHAGNVLRSERKPWLVIDPKPFVGDPAYDATQHLFNCRARLRSDPDGAIGRFADLIGLDRERLRLWIFARAAAEPRSNWNNDLISLARRLAPR